MSLGVDILVPKACSYDCVFCEVGRTTCRTLDRHEYVPVEAVVAELEAWHREGGHADRITVAGSGEPTLHPGVGEVLDAIRRLGAAPSALLTNGSLLYLPEVRTAACRADLVKASLSAWDDVSYEAINRPAPGLRFEAMVSGLRAFRAEFHGEFWLEVVLVKGLNDSTDGVRQIARLAAGIRPDRVHLNTVVRPPAEPSALAVSDDRLRDLSLLFDPVAEVVAGFARTPCRTGHVEDRDLIAMLGRRPCTEEDLEQSCGVEPGSLAQVLRRLVREGALRVVEQEGRSYYRAMEDRGDHR